MRGMRKPAILKLMKANQLSVSSRPFEEPLASCCFPLVSRCLNHDPVSRPSMRHVSELVSSWPDELNFEPLMKDFGGLGSDREAPLSPGLYGELARARNLLPSDTDSKSKKRGRTRSTPVSGAKSSRESPVADKSSTYERPKQQHSNGSLPVLQEGTTSATFRTGAVTPRVIEMVSLLETVDRWNFALNQLPCCLYHASINEALEVIEELKCKPCALDCGLEQDLIQCPSCHMFDQRPPGRDEFECSTCGYLSSSCRSVSADVTVSSRGSGAELHRTTDAIVPESAGLVIKQCL